MMLSMQTDAQNRIRAFFGRRQGHPLRRHQAGLVGTLLPRVAVDLEKPAPADLRALFPAGTTDCRLEIGFGGAEHLAAQAQAHPAAGFIGSDGFENAIAKALAFVEQHALANVRLHHGDAVHLLEWLPAASLARVDLLYPDPWPKRRHWKRRFVQDESLALIARAIRPGGELRFATDIADYAAWTLARILRSSDFEWTAETADDWRKPWQGFTRTRYEAKAIREGRVPAYFIFRRK
jgi:tRNA (guanine-N7-)-methyltransferase